MQELTTAGLVLAATVALVAALLGRWEKQRPAWSRPIKMDLVSMKLRRVGLILMWLESLLMAIGSLLPTANRSDMLLFVSVWGVVGMLAVLLVGVAIGDTIARLLARRIRLALLHREIVAWSADTHPNPDDLRFNENDMDLT